VPRRVLIVEDDVRLRALLQEVFTGLGYAVALAGNGHEALDHLAGEPPDLVLSDVMMPGMDGRALAVAMQADAAFRRIPLVLISAGPPTIFEGIPCAAALSKPFGLTEIRATVDGVLAIPSPERTRPGAAGIG
jgi:CheY-like chemotaxis protein